MTSKGLSTKQVKKLQEKFGFNEILDKSESSFKRFFKKFIGPIPLMIETALLLSIVSKHWEDFSVIFVLLVINIGVDFIQEQKAHKALKSLKKNLSPKAFVFRDNKLIEIDARELVPGDIVNISSGEIMPADGVIHEGYLEIDQSAITGESLSVEKEKEAEVFSGTVVHKGKALVEITKIGKNAVIGKSIELVAKAENEAESHFQKAILKIGKFLIILSSILIIIVFAILMYRHKPLIDALQFSLVLAVASIPVALPAVLSVTMAIGARTLAKYNAIVSNMKAIEELAGTDVLCVDKTGTLTKNEIEVLSPQTYEGFSIEELFLFAKLATDPAQKEPIEKAIFRYSKKNKIAQNLEKFKVEKFIPFDPIRKHTEAIISENDSKFTLIFGAPQIILDKIDNKKIAENIYKIIGDFANKGFRTLAVAKRETEGFKIVGIIPLADPPRNDSAQAVHSIKEKGIMIKMLTGDHHGIAQFIAKKLNIGSRITSGEILRLKKDKNKKIEIINNSDIFTEVVPEDKYNVVACLQANNHIVAMTGDGVNDAPALKKADIGIAVSGATAAARSSADIVLLDSGLSVIKKAIENARMIFSRMQSYATFRIAETIRVVLFISFSVIIFGYSPISALMIILLALLNDIPVMAIAYDNAPISEKPIRWHLRETLVVSSILGVMGLISSFGLFYWLHVSGFEIAIIQTIVFLKLDVSGHSTLYVTRTGRKHFWERPFPSLKFFLPAFGSRIIGTILALGGFFMTPISITTVAYIWIYATVWFLINDQIKVLTFKILDKK